jgi:hypothetical protein
MSLHNYTRDLASGAYNINNPLKVDGEGNQIDLYEDINQDADFLHKFDIKCNGTECNITFTFDLDSSQITKLDTIVSNHKNYS